MRTSGSCSERHESPHALALNSLGLQPQVSHSLGHLLLPADLNLWDTSFAATHGAAALYDFSASHETPETSLNYVFDDPNKSWAEHTNSFEFPNYQYFTPGFMAPTGDAGPSVFSNPVDLHNHTAEQPYDMDAAASLVGPTNALAAEQNHSVPSHTAATTFDGTGPVTITGNYATGAHPTILAQEQQNTPSSSAPVTEIRCKWPGCRNKRAFGRIYEYERHMKKHTQSVSIPCPIVYCPRRSRPFYREDKFRDHLRIAHNEYDVSRCLVDDCNAPEMPLNVLRVHAPGHIINLKICPELKASGDFRHAVSRGWLREQKCELKKCKQWFGGEDTSNIQQHLLGHSVEDRRAQADVMKKMGYDALTANIICPVCDQQYPRFAQFLLHLENEHLITDSVHWLSFKGDFRPDNKTTTLYVWYGWRRGLGGSEERDCRYCGKPAGHWDGLGSTWIDHHLDLLSMSDEVKKAKGAILRLIPDFRFHPVFKSHM